MSFKRRILIGIILVAYICILLMQYHGIIAGGPLYWGLGPNFEPSREQVVAVQRFTAALFVFPILVFLLRDRALVYTFAALTIVLSVVINPCLIFGVWYLVSVAYLIVHGGSLSHISEGAFYIWPVFIVICLVIAIIATRSWDKKAKAEEKDLA
jgi:hypothetical protein